MEIRLPGSHRYQCSCSLDLPLGDEEEKILVNQQYRWIGTPFGIINTPFVRQHAILSNEWGAFHFIRFIFYSSNHGRPAATAQKHDPTVPPCCKISCASITATGLLLFLCTFISPMLSKIFPWIPLNMLSFAM